MKIICLSELGNKKAEAQGEGSLSKGHNSKGEQNYHHKDEYSKSSTFFDEENDEGDEFESKGENTSFDGSNLGRVIKNDQESDYNQGTHSNKEESNKGKFHKHILLKLFNNSFDKLIISKDF